ncbi:GTP cyclohydrolase 1 type 2 [Novipirellula aureliae]|uniref:GTP cyclohydrolase 1 type 2 homolog n=1 Tax=Novipirellula aureliae TaxID=2527966 RepID=A0A5C6E7D1_9BACT|nr:Nif3-like dinuclear metal center hexameric protein [Novipirellula aureliae]TWU45553.1 GTP cyclohydrolase 1 type 2 [Novipirellula aureliae]
MSVISVDQLCQLLAEIAPLQLAETWDNVGLLVGDRSAEVNRVMTCLTVTPAVVEEAVSEKVDLLVSHHPLPFKPTNRITTDTTAGSMLIDLIQAGTAIYSAHTAFDTAANGINQMWADRLELRDVKPLVEPESSSGHEDDLDRILRPGRVGELPQPTTTGAFVLRVGCLVGSENLRYIGDAERLIRCVAIACGSGGSFLSAAKRRGCDAMITGEATFHACLEAESVGIELVLVGHYQSERFAMERLAEQLAVELPELTIWASQRESDPLRFLE